MGVANTGSDGGGTLTLAFDTAALDAVERPERVYADARTWSRYVGIVSREPRAGERYARTLDVAQDFFAGDRGKHESLALVKQQFGTDRHVFVGTTDEDRRLADAAGWEYVPIEEAAAKAGWALDSSDGFLERVVHVIADRLSRFGGSTR